MEPFSATAISTLCVTSRKILVGFYEYINDVVDVPRYVEELTTELSSLNAALLALKALLVARKDSGADAGSQALLLDSCRELVATCADTLKQIEDCVSKSKIKTNKVRQGPTPHLH